MESDLIRAADMTSINQSNSKNAVVPERSLSYNMKVTMVTDNTSLFSGHTVLHPFGSLLCQMKERGTHQFKITSINKQIRGCTVEECVREHTRNLVVL